MIRLVPKNLRTIKLWVRYDPKRRAIVKQAKFKNQLAEPSKASGHVLVELKGFYLSREAKP